MTIGELRRAIAQLPAEMMVMVLGEGAAIEAQVGDVGDFNAECRRADEPAAVLWLIGDEWGAPARARA